jgi:N-methylhydantoinase B/oxoprolinase/acetone carboxylase alpha subunit
MTGPEFDPIELELFKNLFVSISEEMGAVLGRTALSPNIKERKDFSCALFNKHGETFAQGSHIPVHLGAMPLSVQASLKSVNFKEGDLVVLNDPYRGGTHLPDLTCISPLFVNGELCFFVANRAHHSDIGGMTPGSMPLATEIYQEGLIIPPVKLVSEGRMHEDLLELILANVRTPEERRGDLMAQVAANHKGLQRFKDVIVKHGVRKVTQYGRFIQDYTEQTLREAITQIPDGRYAFADFMDNDGISETAVKIGVELKIHKDEATVDFSASSPQVLGGINANYAVTYSAVLYVFRALVDEDIPFNTGLFRPLTIHASCGSVVNANPPAATAAGNVETSQRIVDVLLGCLAQAIPERIPAASSGTMNNVTFGGFDPVQNRSFAYYETIGGGMGACSTRDGLSGIHTHMTNSLNTPLEAMEHYLPLRIRRYGLRPKSGGRGRFNGGHGIVREYEFLVPTHISIMSERRKFSPYGLRGGKPGAKGRNVLIQKGTKTVLSSKVNTKASPGDVLCIETPGGGGYGSKD